MKLSELKRYELDTAYDTYPEEEYATAVEDEKGDWIYYPDVEKLIAELEAEKKAIAKKAFNAGSDLSDEEWWLGEYATTENLKEHTPLKYKDFEEWYKQEEGEKNG